MVSASRFSLAAFGVCLVACGLMVVVVVAAGAARFDDVYFESTTDVAVALIEMAAAVVCAGAAAVAGARRLAVAVRPRLFLVAGRPSLGKRYLDPKQRAELHSILADPDIELRWEEAK